MGIDRPDDADVPRGGHPHRPADRGSAAGGGKTPAETRSHEECYIDLRGAAGIEKRTEPAGRAEPAARSKPPGSTENEQQAKAAGNWEEKADLSRWMWAEYRRRWPPEERTQVERSDDPSGCWRGDSGRSLGAADNAEVEQECEIIADREKQTISPRLRDVESCDPSRHLIGFDDRLKSHDRIKEKVAKSMAEKGLSPKEAVSAVPDTIRYTLQYDEARYVLGIKEDIKRMKERGFKLDILKNTWSDDQYKGINSQWTEPATGQRFELQFHTRISYEAKQITHTAYERLRTKQADAFEELVLEAFQKKVAADVTVPRGVMGIPDYPERGQDAR